MANRYPLIAAAVAAAVGSLSSWQAGANGSFPPLTGTPSASNPQASLVIAGSSAAAPSIQNAIQVDFCGGSGTTPGANGFVLDSSSVGGSKNFLAWSCFAAHAIGTVASGSLITIYYR